MTQLKIDNLNSVRELKKTNIHGNFGCLLTMLKNLYSLQLDSFMVGKYVRMTVLNSGYPYATLYLLIYPFFFFLTRGAKEKS